MIVVFDGVVWTSYAQLQLTTGEAVVEDPREAFVGQSNGLCGAAVAGALFLITGTHTGEVPVWIELHDRAPELGEWDEIVEADLHAVDTGAALSGWASDPAVRFTLPGSHLRARWCAIGMDAGRSQDVATLERPAPDHYALQLWPAASRPDAVIRRTSETAAYWHDHGFTAG